MANKVVAFLEARLSERSTQVQIIVLGLCGAVAGGLVTTEQVTSWSAEIVALLAIVSPLAGVLIPDRSATAAEAADTLIKAASDAVSARVPGSAQIATDIAGVLDAAAPVLAAAGAPIAPAAPVVVK